MHRVTIRANEDSLCSEKSNRLHIVLAGKVEIEALDYGEVLIYTRDFTTMLPKPTDMRVYTHNLEYA